MKCQMHLIEYTTYGTVIKALRSTWGRWWEHAACKGLVFIKCLKKVIFFTPRIAQDIFWRLQKQDHLVEDTLEQLQCVECKRFDFHWSLCVGLNSTIKWLFKFDVVIFYLYKHVELIWTQPEPSIVKRDDVRYNSKQVTVGLVLVFIHPVPVRDTSPRALQRNEREFGLWWRIFITSFFKHCSPFFLQVSCWPFCWGYMSLLQLWGKPYYFHVNQV